MSATPYNVAPTAGFTAANQLSSLAPTITAGKAIDMKDPSLNPFMVLVHDTQKQPAVNNISYLVHDDNRIPRTATVTVDAASGAQTIYVSTDDVTLFAPWDNCYVPEKEYRFQVVSVATATGALTVVPNADNGKASAVAAGDTIYNLGKTLTDGTDLTQMINTIPASWTGYIENFQRVVSITRMGENLGNYYKSPHFKRLWDQAVFAFNADMDWKLMFNGKGRSVLASTLATAAGGTYSNPAQNGGYVGFTEGFWYWHRANADSSHKVYHDALTEFGLIDDIEVAFDEKGGSDHKVCYIPDSMASAMLKWQITNKNFTKMAGDGKDMPLGLKFNRYEHSILGIVDFVRYFPFEPVGANQLARFAIIDKNRIGYVPYSGMDTFIERNLPTTAQMRIDYIGAAIGSVWHQANAHVTAEVLAYTV